MKKRYSLMVRGEHSYWGFEVRADPRFVEMWRADGIEITEIEKTKPEPRLFRVGYFLYNCFHLKNPFA